jgi:hypothetical protein
MPLLLSICRRLLARTRGSPTMPPLTAPLGVGGRSKSLKMQAAARAPQPDHSYLVVPDV